MVNKSEYFFLFLQLIIRRMLHKINIPVKFKACVEIALPILFEALHT